MSFEKLNPLLHSQLRLAIMSLLVSVEKADFSFIKEKTEATSGNISVQIGKLEDAGYLNVKKTFKNKRPNTSYRITQKGVKAFEKYVDNLQQYLNVSEKR